MFGVRIGFMVVCLSVVGVESYWYQYLGSGPYLSRNWKLHRRSLNCAETEDSCRHSSECCDSKDVCMRDRQQGGICRNIESLKLNPGALKPLGAQCSDSAECGVGLCCRGVFRFRFGKVNRCQKSDGPFMCISSDVFEY